MSPVIIAFIVYILLNPSYGVVNQLIVALGGSKIQWYSQSKYWPFILTITHIWQTLGMNCIIYYAPLMSLDDSLLEAARLDGANKWQETWHVLIPHLIPVMVISTILGMSSIFQGDFGLFYQVPKDIGLLYALDFEAYAGREYDNRSFHEMPLRFELTAYCHDAVSENAYYDLFAVKKAAEMFPETDYRRIQMENYLTAAMNLLDCRAPGSEAYFASLKAASAYLHSEFYEKFCGREDVIANCLGHTHIDVAWLWRIAQTRAKACRSFATELALMDEYPEHYFMSSQPQLYQFVKEDCPEIYEKIKERVKEGRWEVEGAMWLEADCNLTSGESLTRQILHGKRFMRQEFGVDSHILWLPDVFGYSSALPQILKKSGIDTFVTSKIHWSETNHFPYDTFLWKGVDGSEIFT